MRQNVTWAALIALSLTLSTAALADKPVDQRCALSAQGRVEMSFISGDLKIQGTDGAEVVVTGTIGDDAEELRVDCESGHVSIELEVPQRSGNNLKIDAKLRIQVPRGAQVSASTVSANVGVANVGGRLDIESVSGELAFEGDLGTVSAESVSGKVLVRGSVAEGELQSVSGDVVVDRARGRLEASSVSGDVKILGGQGSSGKAESVSGNIVWRAGVESGGKLDLESHNGSVNLALPPGSGAEIRASSFSGSISNNLSQERAQEEALGMGRNLHATVGDGGARIEIETFSGKIILGAGK
jgi:DUF4097 and DUF4098 domain-containing protein YvlB